jgi:hypothetical protein
MNFYQLNPTDPEYFITTIIQHQVKMPDYKINNTDDSFYVLGHCVLVPTCSLPLPSPRIPTYSYIEDINGKFSTWFK